MSEYSKVTPEIVEQIKAVVAPNRVYTGADINEDFSQELKDIIYKCLALNPWDRPTARQIADYTSQHINGSPVPFSL